MNLLSQDSFPLTPLEYLREKVGYNPYLFWGLSNEKVVGRGGECNTPIYEYNWQAADQVSRSQMREYLYEAEQQILTEAQFAVAPHYGEQELVYLQENTLALTPLYNATQWGAGDPFARWTSVQLREGYIQALGVEVLTFLENATVTLSDENSDGLIDTFTLTFSTTETNPNNIAVYFNSSDRDGAPVGAEWRIQPVTVSIDTGTQVCTVIGRSWLIIQPILYQKAIQQAPLDPDETSNYAASLAVYTRVTDPNGVLITDAQATMVWETNPLPTFLCPSPTSGSTDPATVGYAVARSGIRNAKLGIVTPAQAAYNATTQLWYENFPIWNWRPDRVIVRYYAGYPLDADGQVSRKLRDITTDLAIASIPRRIVACDESNLVVQNLQWDLARTANGVEQYGTTFQQLNSIWGTRRGQVQAYRKLKHLSTHRGVTY